MQQRAYQVSIQDADELRQQSVVDDAQDGHFYSFRDIGCMKFKFSYCITTRYF